MTEFVKKYFPNAVQMDRLCNCCNQPMYTVRYKYGRINPNQEMVAYTAQCLGDCPYPEVETLNMDIEEIKW